jgi:hypothetical protein
MPKVIERLWVDRGDPHRMHVAVQILNRPHQHTSNGVHDKEWRSGRIPEGTRLAQRGAPGRCGGNHPTQALDEAIACE